MYNCKVSVDVTLSYSIIYETPLSGYYCANGVASTYETSTVYSTVTVTTLREHLSSAVVFDSATPLHSTPLNGVMEVSEINPTLTQTYTTGQTQYCLPWFLILVFNPSQRKESMRNKSNFDANIYHRFYSILCAVHQPHLRKNRSNGF